MKNLLVTILFLGIASYVGLLLYESWGKGDWLTQKVSETGDDKSATNTGPMALSVEDEVASLSYPANVSIESLDGRKIDVILVARSASDIQFERSADGQYFTYPLNELVDESRAMLLAYAETGLIEGVSQSTDTSVTLSDHYSAQLEERITKIEKLIQSKRLQFDATPSKTEKRTLIRQMEKLVRERADLSQKLAVRKEK